MVLVLALAPWPVQFMSDFLRPFEWSLYLAGYARFNARFMSENPGKKKTGRKRTGRTGTKKSYYLNEKLINLLQQEADEERRSASSMLGLILEERYKDQIAGSDDDKDCQSKNS